MKQSKIAMWLIIGLAAAFILWRVSFFVPQGKLADKGAKTETSEGNKKVKPDEVEKTADSNKPASSVSDKKAASEKEPNKPVEPNKPQEPNKPVDSNKPADPNKQMEALNLKDVEMKDIVQKLAEWTGKVIIPSEDAMKQRITIYSAEKMPRKQALQLIYGALRAKGFIAEHDGGAIYIKPIKEAKIGPVPTIPPDMPLASLENREQVVQKFFKLKNYSPSRMNDIIVPMIGDYGYVSADEPTGTLLVIDSVDNLIRIECVIRQFDVPEAEETVEEIFKIQHGDPSEIVQLLRLLLSEGRGADTSRAGARSSSEQPSQQPQPSSGPGPGPSPGGQPPRSESRAGGATTSVVLGPSHAPIILIPEQKRKWIIARASAEDMNKIREWIDKLDKSEPSESEYETVQLRYAEASEVASRLNTALQQMPGAELKTSVLVQALTQARQIMIFGRPEMRDMVKKLIQEIDIPSGLFETKSFKLKHADPDQIKKNIDELYADINADLPYYYRRYQESKSPDTVKVISFPTMQQVTVIASAENMRKIEEQLKEWDVPIDVEKVKPLVIELQNTDPVKMAEMLTKLFSEKTTQVSFYELYFGGGQEKRKIVGALYGQLTFEAVPGSKKIIVISKMPEAYAVIEKMIRELDKEEMAEVPMVVVLKYADPEELSERLNAIFNEAGTAATIRRRVLGLSAYSMETTGAQTRTPMDTSRDPTAARQNEYTPPWSRGRPRTDEMPISNVIGRIRFIPDPRSKAILVLAPPEYLERIKEMVGEMDLPAKQVMVKAMILQVNRDNLASLGIQLASNPAAFGSLGENAVTALNQVAYARTQGYWTISAGTNITALVDLLIKKTGARILNQPTLWTKDNEEAEFFKGQRVAFITGSQTSVEGTSITQSVDYRKVGVVLRVRPNITPKKDVDMTVNLMVSQVLPDLINNQIALSELNTTTNLIVEDGGTIMLGGILFQNDSRIERKLPLLGDIPLAGAVFRHYDVEISNDELVVFITPFVKDANTSPEAAAAIEQSREKMESELQQLRSAVKDVNNN